MQPVRRHTACVARCCALGLYPEHNNDAALLNNMALKVAGEPLDFFLTSLAEAFGIRTHVACCPGRAHAYIADYAREVSSDVLVAATAQEDRA